MAQNRFAHLDSRESEMLDSLKDDEAKAFENVVQDYRHDFRPEDRAEEDIAYCLASLRWGIERVRQFVSSVDEIRQHHGYLPQKFLNGLDELRDYERELMTRYECYFSVIVLRKREREKAYHAQSAEK